MHWLEPQIFPGLSQQSTHTLPLPHVHRCLCHRASSKHWHLLLMGSTLSFPKRCRFSLRVQPLCPGWLCECWRLSILRTGSGLCSGNFAPLGCTLIFATELRYLTACWSSAMMFDSRLTVQSWLSIGSGRMIEPWNCFHRKRSIQFRTCSRHFSLMSCKLKLTVDN